MSLSVLHILSYFHTFYYYFVLIVKPCPNVKCLEIKHDQTLFGDQTCWCRTDRPNGIKNIWQTVRITHRKNWVENDIMLSSRDDLASTQRSSIVNSLKAHFHPWCTVRRDTLILNFVLHEITEFCQANLYRLFPKQSLEYFSSSCCKCFHLLSFFIFLKVFCTYSVYIRKFCPVKSVKSKVKLTSLYDSYGSWHLYICCSLFGLSTFSLLHSCLWRALHVVL